jgi:NAD(P)-dependent dehydrogenase (short-subunit alcohol dehydrogenase family)
MSRAGGTSILVLRIQNERARVVWLLQSKSSKGTAVSLTDQRALVTGATAGIGREVAKLLAAEGAYVLVSGRDQTRGAETVSEIEAAAGRAAFLESELSTVEGARALAKAAGQVDVLINNASLYIFGMINDITPDQFDAMFDINVRGLYYLTAGIAPAMAARGRGAIVNVTTMASEFGMPGSGAFGASKAAVASLTRTWAAEYGPSGVRVNAVSPGPTRTPSSEPLAALIDQTLGAIPLGRAAEARETAETIAFLASDRSSYVTGAVLRADGGRAAV